jgi:hypothetical protein
MSDKKKKEAIQKLDSELFANQLQMKQKTDEINRKRDVADRVAGLVDSNERLLDPFAGNVYGYKEGNEWNHRDNRRQQNWSGGGGRGGGDRGGGEQGEGVGATGVIGGLGEIHGA